MVRQTFNPLGRRSCQPHLPLSRAGCVSLDRGQTNYRRDRASIGFRDTAHLPERKKMMQDWADYLDKLKDGVDVIPLRREA